MHAMRCDDTYTYTYIHIPMCFFNDFLFLCHRMETFFVFMPSDGNIFCFYAIGWKHFLFLCHRLKTFFVFMPSHGNIFCFYAMYKIFVHITFFKYHFVTYYVRQSTRYSIRFALPHQPKNLKELVGSPRKLHPIHAHFF